MQNSGWRVIKVPKAEYVAPENATVIKQLMETKGILLTG
jgi:hypothetical protein